MSTHPPNGFSSIEILITMLIYTMSFVALFMLTAEMPIAAQNTELSQAALIVGSDVLQEALIRGSHDFPGVISIATTSAEVPGSTTLSPTYTVSLQVSTNSDGYSKTLTSSTEWKDIRNVARYLVLQAILTDTTDTPEDACAEHLKGDWLHARSTTLSLTSGSLFPATSTIGSSEISSLDTTRWTLALGAASTTQRTSPTLFLFSISSSTHPLYLSSIDTAPSTRTGVAAVALSETALFAASAQPANYSTCTASTACSQLQVFSISTTSTLQNVMNYKLATATPPFTTGSDGQATGKSIFLAGSLLYLGLTKTNTSLGEEFNIIDVHTPSAPMWLGGYRVGRTINQIRVSRGYAYLATDDPHQELIVLDVHDSQHPRLVSTYDAPGPLTFGYGESVSTDPQGFLALGRSYTPTAPELAFMSLPVARPGAVALSTTLIGSTTSQLSVQGLILRMPWAFVLTDQYLRLWDTSDPTRPVETPAAYPLPGTPNASAMALSCSQSTVYAASNSGGVGSLTILTGF